MGRLWQLVVIALGAVACAVTDPRDPPLTGPPQEPQQSGEQAETDGVLARTLDGLPVIVVGHRYTGPNRLNNDPNQPFDITYTQPTHDGVAFLRGSSIMGWSYSLNGGFSWEAPGKVYPENAFGDPVALLWSDPALASGLSNPSLVAYASLAASKQAFDAVTGSTETGDLLFGWPPDVDRPDFPGTDNLGIVDSVCVALSLDGGISFEAPICRRPAGIGVIGTDQTTVAIGALDRIYVAVDDFSNGEIKLFEAVYIGVADASLVPIPMPSEMIGFSRGPELRRDQDGIVWLAGASTTGTIRMCRITNTGCQYVGQVAIGTDLFAVLPGGVVSAEPLRSGSSADFGVNRIHLTSDLTAREFVFAYSRTQGDRRVVGLSRCSLVSLGGTLFCEDIPAWGSAPRAGQHLQPNIEFVDKSPAQDGSGADWRYAFYEFARDDVAAGHAQVTLGRLAGALPSTSAPSASFIPLAAPDPEVCPADYPGNDYWGDYFALLALPPIPPSGSWRHLGAYSSDEGRGCTPVHPRQGRHLHVVAWSWVD